MFRILFVLLALAVVPSLAMPAASAQSRDACARDVSRLCRSVMNDGDSAILACLKQHRSRVGRACDKVMTENGQ
jgi:hypothetical protein